MMHKWVSALLENGWASSSGKIILKDAEVDFLSPNWIGALTLSLLLKLPLRKLQP